MIPVEGHKGLYRDESSTAIINTDIKGYEDYITTKQNYIEEKTRMDKLEDEIKDIKSLLLKLLENK